MTAPKTPQDRRQDYARRLRIAVRKAHDPLFSLLQSAEEKPVAKSPVPPPPER